MEEAMAARYWCHMCSQMVNPIMEMEQVEQIKCPFCHSGFVEEMGTTAAIPPTTNTRINDSRNDSGSDFGSDRALSLWAPILLGMMGNPRRRRRFRRIDFDDFAEDEDDDDDDDDADDEHRHGGRGGDSELDRELDSVIRRRRRRSSAAMLQLLQSIRAGLASSESQNSNSSSENNNNRENRDERERVILINPFNQTVIVQNDNQNVPLGMGSLGDYFIGPGLDLLLQHLAENDPNRYGTPPAKKEAIEGLPTVSIKDSVQCSVCLDDFEIGSDAKEMPCKHKFHTSCILPWLDLHSSCPVCRFQLPADDSKRSASSDGSSTRNPTPTENNSSNAAGATQDGDGTNGGGRRFSFPWPFNGLFSSSSSGSQSSGGSSSTSTSTSPAADSGRTGNRTSSQTDHL